MVIKRNYLVFNTYIQQFDLLDLSNFMLRSAPA